MIQTPMDVLKDYPVRKSGKQKKAFRTDVSAYLTGLGYFCKEEKGSLGSRNLIAGDPEQAKYLITAHYDTPAVLPFPNLITPCNLFLFVAYQLLLSVLILLVVAVICLAVVLSTGIVPLGAVTLNVVTVAMVALMLAGPANKNNANDNTSGVVTVMEIARTLPENLRSKVCFVLFDLEEAGMIGSASYRSAHKKATQNQIVLNMDCVGDGDRILFAPTGRLKKNKNVIDLLKTCEGTYGEKTITVRDKGLTIYPSDQTQFPYGVGIAGFHRSKLVGLYMGRIHTKRDTVLQMTNVNLLRACLISMIGRSDD